MDKRTSMPRSSAKKRPRRGPPGDVQALQRELWFAIRRATGILDDMNADAHEVLRAVNALSVASNAYLRALEAGEMHEQLQELWSAHQAQQGKLP